jgi:hypothetical protein
MWNFVIINYSIINYGTELHIYLITHIHIHVYAFIPSFINLLIYVRFKMSPTDYIFNRWPETTFVIFCNTVIN